MSGTFATSGNLWLDEAGYLFRFHVDRHGEHHSDPIGWIEHGTTSYDVTRAERDDFYRLLDEWNDREGRGDDHYSFQLAKGLR